MDNWRTRAIVTNETRADFPQRANAKRGAEPVAGKSALQENQFDGYDGIACRYCDRIMSKREAREQGACDDCCSGERRTALR